MQGYSEAEEFSHPYYGFRIPGNWIKKNFHANCGVSLKATAKSKTEVMPRDKAICSAAIKKD